MSYAVPENLTRLRATVFVTNAELSNAGRVEMLRTAAEKLAESGLRKLMDDCITTRGDYMGHTGNVLELDVYVMSPHELKSMLAKARDAGYIDARRNEWNFTTNE